MKKTIVSLAAGFLLAGAATTSVSAQEYQVQEGDTLSGLSQEFDVTVDDLKAWNDLDSDLIVVDQLLDIQNEDAADNAENQDVAPVDEQAQSEAPAEPSDDEEDGQEKDQPEADEEEETQPAEEPSNEQAAEHEGPNTEESQQKENGEAVENNEDEAVEQEPANEDPAEEPAPQEPSDDQAVEQEEADPEGNEEEPTNDEDNNEDADTSEGETMTMSSTAYTAGCEGCSGTTADGTELSGDENVVAVDPDKIPIGSEVHVEGYGDAIAADTGGDINGDRIDLHMSDEGEANDWGHQDVEVTVK